MAFKMNGMNFGMGTGSAKNVNPAAPVPTGPLTQKYANQSERAAARLAEKEERLTKKMRDERVKDTDSKKADRLAQRIANIKDKKARKEQMAKNLAEGKKKRANLSKDVTRDLVVADLKTEKSTNEKGRKTEVKRELTNKEGEIIRGTDKKKSGEGLNVTTDKTITKKSGEKVVKKESEVKKPAISFGDAFKAARKSGAKTFTWKGKSYHTRQKEEDEGYVKKGKGESGPQTEAAQKYDETRKTPFTKK